MGRSWQVGWVAMILVALAGCRPSAAPGPSSSANATTGGNPPVRELDPKDFGGVDVQVIAAWQQAGWGFGWFVLRPDGGRAYLPTLPPDSAGLPALVALGQEAGSKLHDLPAPQVAFGLGLAGSRVTDAELQHLG